MTSVLSIKGTQTQYIEDPEWTGDEFSDVVAQKWWKEMPVSLRKIVLSELAAGNKPEQIMRNSERNIVLLSLAKKPITQEPLDKTIRIHKSHAYGNYCYDGTFCTYEELSSGCFIAFEDPDYDHEIFIGQPV